MKCFCMQGFFHGSEGGKNGRGFPVQGQIQRWPREIPRSPWGIKSEYRNHWRCSPDQDIHLF